MSAGSSRMTTSGAGHRLVSQIDQPLGVARQAHDQPPAPLASGSFASRLLPARSTARARDAIPRIRTAAAAAILESPCRPRCTLNGVTASSRAVLGVVAVWRDGLVRVAVAAERLGRETARSGSSPPIARSLRGRRGPCPRAPLPVPAASRRAGRSPHLPGFRTAASLIADRVLAGPSVQRVPLVRLRVPDVEPVAAHEVFGEERPRLRAARLERVVERLGLLDRVEHGRAASDRRRAAGRPSASRAASRPGRRPPGSAPPRVDGSYRLRPGSGRLAISATAITLCIAPSTSTCARPKRAGSRLSRPRICAGDEPGVCVRDAVTEEPRVGRPCT